MPSTYYAIRDTVSEDTAQYKIVDDDGSPPNDVIAICDTELIANMIVNALNGS